MDPYAADVLLIHKISNILMHVGLALHIHGLCNTIHARFSLTAATRFCLVSDCVCQCDRDAGPHAPSINIFNHNFFEMFSFYFVGSYVMFLYSVTTFSRYL